MTRADRSPLAGLGWMLAAAVTFTLAMSLVRTLGEEYSPAVQAVYRQLAACVVLLPLVMRGGWRQTMNVYRPGRLFWRSALSALALILTFYSYQMLPLAEANALSFTRTLWVVPLAALFLKETLGLSRVGAVAIGFGGALVILDPAHLSLGLPQAAALAASLMFAVTIVEMKRLSRDHEPLAIMTWSAIVALLFTLPLALLDWRWPSWRDLAQLFAMGTLGVVTQGLYLRGLSSGDAIVLVPVDYSRLVFAALFGYLFFGEVISLRTLVGATIIIGTTLFLSWDEYRGARASVITEGTVV
jgi:drug/metabolite transporter (DMT)-like permease